MEELLEKLNEEQIKPVLDTEGAVLVLAGAGSGKTRVLTTRIAHILDKRLCSPYNVLAITFTNKAAREMQDRLSSILGDVSGMWICTIHSMCVRILRRHGDAAGIRSNFSIYSETERSNVIKRIFKDLDYDEKILKSVKFHIANAKTLGLDPDQYEVRFKDENNIKQAVEVFSRYNEYLRECNALDFDDLLVETLRLLRGHEEVREYLSDKFKYVHVDEFQDTNSVQYNIIRLLSAKHGNLFVVGDDDQSIYGWRGAEIENILKFDRDYPQAKVYKLQRNYRSTGAILKLANVVIAKNGKRHKKTLWTEEEDGVAPEYVQAEDEKDEALFAAKTINAAVYAGGKYSDFAVLMRINALTRSYEQEFAKYGIPYRVFGGFKFFERKEIKDVLAYLRLLCNPFDDEAFTRIINVPRRGIGLRTLDIMSQYAHDNGLSLYDACIDVDDLPLTSSAKSKIKDFSDLLKKMIIVSQSENVGNLVRALIISADLKTAYDDHTDEGDAKLANLDELIAAADDYARLNPEATLNDYLNQVTLASDTDDMDDGNYVTLATIHSVKGLEYNNIFICGLEDGIMPTSRAKDDPSAIEEERRLMYVAVTRARKLLWLTRSKSRYLYGHREATIPSMFLRDLQGCISMKEEDSSYGRRSGYGGYGNRGYGGRGQFGQVYGSRSSTYGGDGYEGDFWQDGSRGGSDYNGSDYGKSKYSGSGYGGRSVYSSDDGYSPDPAPQSYGGQSYGGQQRTQNASRQPKPFSPAAAFGGAPKSQGGGKNYAVGCKVRHPKFGVGTVIALKNGGAVVNIAFENQGIKELSAAIAPLEIIQN
ncbi:MAG: UvrD-helicase domain-containing protein [Clostridia bacterium]|nr:UvrD-helicase domain-containing protein [Clostridia bacterium]